VRRSRRGAVTLKRCRWLTPRSIRMRGADLCEMRVRSPRIPVGAWLPRRIRARPLAASGHARTAGEPRSAGGR
jgi:hypothetical protein